MTRVHAALLAVDGGGSKTDLALIDRQGKVLAARRVARSSHFGLGDGRAVEGLNAAVGAVCRDIGQDPADKPIAPLGVYCLAGADLAVDERRIHRILSGLGWTRRSLVRNDSLAILRAGTDRGWGVAVVGGSGMNCAGIAPDGREVRYAALGTISGDLAAAGGWLGEMAVAHAVRGQDGRGPRTLLQQSVPRFFSLPTPDAVVEAIYLKRLDGNRLNELAPLVFAAARHRDRVARMLLRSVADEVIAFVGATIKRLGLQRRDVEVILGGGIFLALDGPFHARIENGIHAVASRARIRRLDAPPVVGAALLGLDQLAVDGGGAAAIRSSLTHERLLRGFPDPE